MVNEQGLTGRAVANASASDRNGVDYYPTPPDATKALLQFWGLFPKSVIWECACGEGHMSRVLESSGLTVISTDLHACGYGEGGVDFLTNNRDCDFIITNPPFSLSAQFIERAAKCNVKGFAFLLKSQYWHAAKRLRLFSKHRPSYVCPLTWRPDFLFGKKGGAPTMDCLWAIWDCRVSGSCEYVPLERPAA